MLNIESLVVGNLELYPYYYHEEMRDSGSVINIGEGLAINAKVKMPKEESERFLEFQFHADYFPVVRHGIQEEPREMRFGAVYWSEHEGEIRYSINLVEKSPEDEEPQHPIGVPNAHMRAQLAFETALRRELFEFLKQKEILSDQEIEGLYDKAEKQAWRVENSFYQVRDVDMLP